MKLVDMDASVIIPTLDRNDSLQAMLYSLSLQSLPLERFEVIVVDDGSTDGTDQISYGRFPFAINYLRQTNKGAVWARNRGADVASGKLLVFLDDDMVPDPGYVQALVAAHEHGPRKLVTRGSLVTSRDQETYFGALSSSCQRDSVNHIGDFTSNNLALDRQEFSELGGWIDVIPFQFEHGGGIWADLEFAYRARESGYVLKTVSDARIVHRDYASRSLLAACKRAEMISRVFVPVAIQYPGLTFCTPMFRDKQPISLERDTAALVIRKLARSVSSLWAFVCVMKLAVRWVERIYPSPALLRPLYRWVIGSYIFRGYRKGLLEYGELPTTRS